MGNGGAGVLGRAGREAGMSQPSPAAASPEAEMKLSKT